MRSRRQGHTVIEARDQPEAVAGAARACRPAVVLSDLRLPDGDGFGVLRAAKELDPELPVIVMTAYGSIQDAVAAMKEGALDFLAKPVDPDHLLLHGRARARAAAPGDREHPAQGGARGAARRAADRRRGSAAEAGHDGAASRGGDRRDGAARRRERHGQGAVRARAARAQPARRRSVRRHQLRGDSREPARNRALRLREGRVHRRAARKPGKFELAHRGTLFLDEIGDLPLALQAKILRALEEKRFERVGGTASLQVDVRVVAATNRNLKAAVAARQFREDLYFRLSVFPITIPPLRERPDDIPMLATYFVERFCRDLNKKPLDAGAVGRSTSCAAYPWPGNVRELQNCIERAVILTEGDTIHARHLNLSFRDAGCAPDVSGRRSVGADRSVRDAGRGATPRDWREVERRKIEQALKEAAGDRGPGGGDSCRSASRRCTAKLREYGLES